MFIDVLSVVHGGENVKSQPSERWRPFAVILKVWK